MYERLVARSTWRLVVRIRSEIKDGESDSTGNNNNNSKKQQQQEQQQQQQQQEQ